MAWASPCVRESERRCSSADKLCAAEFALLNGTRACSICKKKRAHQILMIAG